MDTKSNTMKNPISMLVLFVMVQFVFLSCEEDPQILAVDDVAGVESISECE